MKNNKGFTLVELMAVIVILAIIIGIAVPGSIAISHKIKVKMYNTKVNMIEQAAELYVQESSSVLGDVTCFKVQELIDKGYVKKDEAQNVIDPRDNSSLNDIKVCVEKKDRRYKAEFNSDKETIAPAVPLPSSASKLNVGDSVRVSVKFRGGSEIASLKDWYIIQANSTEVLAVSKYVYSNYTFSGETGYQTYVISIAQGIVNIVSTKDGVVNSSRPMGYNGQNGYINSVTGTSESTGAGDDYYKTDYNMVKKALGNAIAYKYNTTTASDYWVMSRDYIAGNANATGEMGLYYVDESGSVLTSGVYKQESTAGTVYWRDWEYTKPVRVIISIDPNAKIESGEGTDASPYQL